ncbi:sporulation protein YpjB [Bacillus marasmi]|uniref:sporulation protein YpjB n=1 Tax=Bacillus marasmi TaxID=1926279 RepID=UPI0011CB177F|nr:sporulation protein YpjB [Bacillus marasmi]
MKVKLLIVYIAVFLMSTITANAEPPSTIAPLDNISDEALEMVKLHRYEDAEKLLQYFSHQYLANIEKEALFSKDDLRIITVAFQDALEATRNNDIPHAEKMNRVTTFRLVIDAISSGQQPLWTEMEEPIMSVFKNAKEAAHSGDNENFHESFNSFLTLYNMIYPSLKIDIPKQQIQSLDAKVSYIDHYRPKVLSHSDNQQELDEVGSDLQSIFDNRQEDEADPSLWWVIISTGSIIILTLSYVGWRKYQGDREQEKNRPTKLKE